MEIRLATMADLPFIAALYIHNWQKTYQGLVPDSYLQQLEIHKVMNHWQAFLQKKRHQIFVACQDGEFLGFVACRPDQQINHCFYLDSLHVDEKARGQGIGTRLIERTGYEAYRLGYVKMSICVVAGNDHAQELYTHLGARWDHDFIDVFDQTRIRSRKLIWDDMECFKNAEV